MVTKNEQRRYLRKLRNELTGEEVAEKSSAISERLVSMDTYKSASTVMLYLSAKNEVDTISLVKKALSDEKKVVVPVTNISDNTLTLSYLDSMEDLCEGAFGIPEPRVVKVCPDSSIELVIVPGLGFDQSGGRIGYGKGYYDRVFARLDAVKTALCYDFQLIDKVCTEEHDVAMDFIITESRVVDCGKI